MPTRPFVFSSANLPKAKAKQLNRAFPFLRLATAQEATAAALGYSSWYECCHRGALGTPSPSDQEAGLSERVLRYYQQANALISFGITPSEADCWVRAWGLTGRPTMAVHAATATFYVWDKALEELEQGAISEQRFVEEFGDGGCSKYPDIDRPARVTSGVIIGPCGKYPHYAIDPAINAKIPVYLRGPHSLYHCEDGVDVLAVCVPQFPLNIAREFKLDRLSDIQHEWHFGSKHPDAPAAVIPELIAQAQANPDAPIVLSNRAMPVLGGGFDHHRRAIACISGREFAELLRNKGVINSREVIWFHDVDPKDTRTWYDWISMGSSKLPVFVLASKYKPGLPVYSYPFMSAPMAMCEYMGFWEQVCLLPLNEDYEDGSGFDAEEDDPEGPDIPALLRKLQEIQSANLYQEGEE